MNLAFEIWLAFQGLVLGTHVGLPPNPTSMPPSSPAEIEQVQSPEGMHLALRLTDGSSPDVPFVWRRLISEALQTMGRDVGIMFCPMSSPCLEKTDNALDYAVDVSVVAKNSIALVHLTLTTEISSPSELASPEPGLFVLQESVFLRSSLQAKERDAYLADRLLPKLVELDALRSWLEGLHQIPGLVPRQMPTVSVESPRTSMESWGLRRDEIVDLLIDDRFEEAARRAEELLQNEELPSEMRPRIETLYDKALQRQAEGTPSPPREPPKPRPGTAVEEREEEEPPPFDYTFRVRAARPGQSFTQGSDGHLRIFEGGIRFDADTSDEDDWSITWQDVSRIDRAQGLWDIRYPLVIETSDGRRHYLTEIHRDGRFSSGSRLLELLAEGRERTGI